MAYDKDGPVKGHLKPCAVGAEVNRLVQPEPASVPNNTYGLMQGKAIGVVVLDKIVVPRLARCGVVQATPDPVRELADLGNLLASPGHVEWRVLESKPKNAGSGGH